MNNNLEDCTAVKRNDIKHRLIGILLFFLVAVLLSIIINSFILEIAVVEGASMEKKLFSNDRLIVFKLEYIFSEPQKNDIIVIRYINQDDNNRSESVSKIEYIKRIIAIPDDVIDLKYQNVYLNNELCVEPYSLGITRQKKMTYPIKIKKNKYFVMGDNREYSRDSRDVGLIDRKDIIGRAIFRIWPLHKFGFIQ